ncbi:unnamed protein product [Lepeophtheirus salmonis]|uniref:(salmon louse) hypothetical protein n=2 Tax=Lepeophtheirus salmonis TaxID=72036 RepID=A0A7R8CIG5_LEPSM|nr:unnamed protein product [Lepeophtheirus salmonis]CAF2832211.1 unnamed protein product [Lepeophtheirus salmonis]
MECSNFGGHFSDIQGSSVSQLESNIKKLLENPDWYEDDSSESNSSFTQEDTSGNEDSSDSNTEEEDGNPKNLKNYNDDDISCQSSDSDSKEPPSKKMCDDCKPSTSMNKTTRTNLKNTVRDIVTYWVAAPSGNTKKDSEVSTESSSDDDDQSTSVPQNKNQPIGPDASSASEIKEIRKKKILKIMYNSRKKHRQQVSQYSLNHLCFFHKPLFSPEIMSYIVYEGLQTFENLMIESKSHNDTAVKKQGSCLHLFVSAIKQILITIHQMEVNAKNSERRYEIHDIILLLMEMSNLRQFHLLLIWKYNLSYQTRCFINDVVMCNHKLLVLFEKVNSSDKFIKEHLDQFARVEVMKQYAYCLETFESNTELLNEAIFTMIHHVSGNLNGHEALLIPEILNTFSNVLENELFFSGEKWSDLIEYMIQRFMNNMNENPVDAPPRLLESVLEEDQSSQYSIPYDRIQFIPLRNNKTINNLQWYYSECKNSEDPVGSIIDMYKEAEYETLTRESVLQGLLSYRIITHAQYIKLAIVKPTLTINNSSSDTTSSNPAELGSQRGESESGQDNIYKKLASDGDLISETKLTRAGKQITNFAKPKIPNMAL